MMRAPILKSAIAGFSLMFFAPLAIAQDGTGAATEQTQALNIPAGPMADALDALVQQSGIQLIYRDADVAGITTAGVRGETTVDAALDVLLQGTELVVTRDATGAMAIGTPNSLADTGADAGPFAEGSASANVAAARRAGVEEIIVTGQKKEERLQDVPIAISAFSMEQLDAQKIEGGFDLLKAIPNVSFTKTNFTGYNFQIRGVGTQSISATSDAGVAVSFNSSSVIQNRLFEQEYLDIERVEVLRGPQGTLYGRNATAGVVNVISHKPELGVWEGEIDMEVGNFQTQRLRGIINVPLGETFAARAAFAMTDREGFTYNAGTGRDVDGRDLWTGRISLGWQPNDRLRADFIWEHFQEEDDRLRTGKQLCHRDAGPAMVGSEPTNFGNPDSQYSSLLGPAFLGQGCKPGSLYSAEAFGTPNGLSLSFVMGMLLTASEPDFGTAPLRLGTDENGNDVAAIQLVDPYGGRRQSESLREIESIRDPVYRATADLVELNIEFDVADGLVLSAQTLYNEDETYSFQDFNRFNTDPVFTDTSKINPLQNFDFRNLAPGGVFCDPQLGCSDRIAGFDIAQAAGEQFSQEVRLQSSIDSPVNFSAGVNYTRFETNIDYYVMYNLITAYALVRPFNAPIDGVIDYSVCSNSNFTALGGGINTPVSINDPLAMCPYVDPNPLDTSRNFEGEGHNYFRSKNPYDLRSLAGFGEIYWNVMDDLKLTAGIRYSDDRKTFVPVPSQVLLAPGITAGGVVNRGYPEKPAIIQGWGEWTGRLVLDWKPSLSFTDETLLYASIARGYKGGGANPPTPGFATVEEFIETAEAANANELVVNNFLNLGIAPVLRLTAVEYGPTFEPEYVNAFEVGAKNTLFGGAVMLNATAFYYNYTDYQVSQIRDRTAVNENFDAEMWGLEVEAMFSPTVNFQILANIGFLKTKIEDGESSIDIMNRTQGSHDYIIAKPWPQLPSNCVAPVAVVENEYRRARENGRGMDPLRVFKFCGGLGGLLGGGNFNGPIDPSMNMPYDVDNYPEINGGAGLRADLSGNELPNSPNLTANLGAQYGFDMFRGEWRTTLRGDAYWQGDSYHRVYNLEPYDRLEDWYNVNLGIKVEQPAQGLAIELYVKNVLDDTPITGAFLNSDDTGLTTNVFTLDPRLIGLSITKQF